MAHITPKLKHFIDNNKDLPTPYLVMDLNMVREKYKLMKRLYNPATIYYAVKANPNRQVLQALADEGACFDVASRGEIDLVLSLDGSITPDRLSYGNTIKKPVAIEHAYAKGVRLFAYDSLDELEKIAQHAPNSDVFCRLLLSCEGAEWPLSRKFGCDEDMLIDLSVQAKKLGLNPVGLSFHVGSQQTNLDAWRSTIAFVAQIADRLKKAGVPLTLLNLGGGMLAQYSTDIPDEETYASVMHDALGRAFGDDMPNLILEPGRGIVADAGIIETEVILVAQKSTHDPYRWVYLDTGVFNGLMETLGEAIRYQLVTDKDPLDKAVSNAHMAPCILAGPSCDSIDVMYEKTPVLLPSTLKSGDRMQILATGAYTTSYASVWFNGFAPIKTYTIE